MLQDEGVIVEPDRMHAFCHVCFVPVATSTTKAAPPEGSSAPWNSQNAIRVPSGDQRAPPATTWFGEMDLASVPSAFDRQTEIGASGCIWQVEDRSEPSGEKWTSVPGAANGILSPPKVGTIMIMSRGLLPSVATPYTMKDPSAEKEGPVGACCGHV
jgi:hypothetical protein